MREGLVFGDELRRLSASAPVTIFNVSVSGAIALIFASARPAACHASTSLAKPRLNSTNRLSVPLSSYQHVIRSSFFDRVGTLKPSEGRASDQRKRCGLHSRLHDPFLEIRERLECMIAHEPACADSEGIKPLGHTSFTLGFGIQEWALILKQQRIATASA
jgi:hypothetical protein